VEVKCPECDANIHIPDDAVSGEIVSCPDCGLELEVKEIQGDMVETQELAIEGEDWGE